ncbi:SDR family NAD(P)-dependent oxidoreductase [Caballeronia sp.]|uniref:SDR family NAD(P)-dependent oxidoreductase n=1 Tax=Caballeronia sp. TaxID=1931223 RepID=UPI003C460381
MSIVRNQYSELKVIVTGVVGGIGSAVVKHLAEGGAGVAIVDRDGAAVDKLASSIAKATGSKVIGLVADVTVAADVERYTQEAVKHLGGLTGVYNNAGANGAIAEVTEYPDDVFDQLIAVNQRGVYLGIKYAARELKKFGGGAIVNTSSVAGLVAFSNMIGYVASKHAVVGLTRAAAFELGKYNIRVNAVCPAPIDTQLMRDVEIGFSKEDPDAARRLFSAAIPLGRYGTTDEVADLVCFLLSDNARFISGAAIPVDGASVVD